MPQDKVQIIGTYIPPTGSPVWKARKQRGKGSIQAWMGRLRALHADGWRIAVAGDLNEDYRAKDQKKAGPAGNRRRAVGENTNESPKHEARERSGRQAQETCHKHRDMVEQQTDVDN